jgi:proline dehydrogenase
MPQSASAIFGMLDDAAKEVVLKMVAEQAKDRFAAYRKAIKQATALKEPRGQARLDAYRARAPEIWAALEAKYPREYQRQQQDMRGLEKATRDRVDTLMGSLSGEDLSKRIRLPAVNQDAAATTPAPIPQLS